MAPALLPGDTVVVNRFAYRFAPPRPGDVVVFRDPRTERLSVKRIEALVGSGSVFLVGDNRSESVDSRHFGSVAAHRIIGRVSFHGLR